ncbi:hypothetical protein PanWU01x14_003780, partial [Parasponia andersonii]
GLDFGPKKKMGRVGPACRATIPRPSPDPKCTGPGRPAGHSNGPRAGPLDPAQIATTTTPPQPPRKGIKYT